MHRDRNLELCAKLAIGKIILERERSSSIFLKEGSRIAAAPPTWFGSFFRLLHTGTSRAEVARLFDNLTVVNFNYDRCFDHYLFHAIQELYSISPSETADLINKNLMLHHPYGSLGKMRWQEGDVPFGHEPTPEELVKLSDGIRTFHEQIEQQDELVRIHAAIQNATTLIFFGYHFHIASMALIKGNQNSKAKQIFATTHHRSAADNAIIGKRIIGLGIDSNPHLTLHGYSCKDFMDVYGLAMAEA